MVEPKEAEAEIETEKLRVAPPPLILDDSGRIRLLHPSRSIRLREISQCAASFRSKITHFHQASKQVVDRVVEEAQKVEAEKQKAIEARCSVSMEIASRPYKVADQRSEFERMREKLENLKVEYESLQVVKHEQELLLARLTHSHGPS